MIEQTTVTFDTQDIALPNGSLLTGTIFEPKQLELARAHAAATGGTPYTYVSSESEAIVRGARYVNRLHYLVLPRDVGEGLAVPTGDPDEDDNDPDGNDNDERDDDDHDGERNHATEADNTTFQASLTTG